MHNLNPLSDTLIFNDENAENDVGRQIKYLGGTNVLVIFNDKNSKVNPLLDKIRRSLKNSGLDYVELVNNDVNPRVEKVFDGLKICQNNEVDFVLCIGGESEFAIAKVIGVAAVYDDNFYNIFKAENDIDKTLPVGIISTSLHTGAAFFHKVQLSHKLDDGSLTFYTCKNLVLRPRFVMFNAPLCRFDYQDPKYPVIRIISYICHRYFSKANRSTVLAKYMTMSSFVCVYEMYKNIKRNPENMDAFNNIIWASVDMALTPMYNIEENVSVDALANAIVGVFDCPIEHAENIVIPAWFEFAKTYLEREITQIGNVVFNVPINFFDYTETCKLTIVKIKEFAKSFDLPYKLRDLGADGTRVEEILYKAGFPEVESLAGYTKLDKTACEVILSLAM